MGTVHVVWLVGLLALVGCSDDAESPPSPPGEGGAGGAPSCVPGEVQAANGACERAGVTACAQGFVSNERGGCRPILPADPCPPGELAIPGESRCRPLVDCGDPPWGDIPRDGTTQHVDQSYAGGDSDGSAAKPWTVIQDAIGAAQSDAIVAIAAGTYHESLISLGASVRLWGRCPELVTVVSDEPWEAVVFDAPGSEAHALGLSGYIGVGAYFAGDLWLDRVRIHATTAEGILGIGSADMPTHVRISDSLVDQVEGAGIVLVSADLTIERSAVREVGGAGYPGAGRGVHVEDDQRTGDTFAVALSRSLVERTDEVGVAIFGGELTLDASVVRDVAARPDGRFGLGVAVQRGYHTASGAIAGSVLQRTSTFGISAVEADVVLLETTLEEIAQQPLDGAFGDALVAVAGPGQEARVSVVASHVTGAARAGIGCFSAAVTLERAAFECNLFHLDGESPYGAFAFEDGGGNACWCGEEAAECKVLSAGLAAPAPLP